MLRHVSALAIALIALGQAVAQTRCPRIAVTAAADYSRVTAAVTGASTGRYRWLVNDAVAASGSAPQSFLLHADSDLLVYETRSPTEARGVALTPSRWGQSFSLTDVGLLAYSRQDNYDPGEGSIEMWVALRADGSDPAYAQRDHVLFHYRAANGEWMWVAQASDTGILYAGGVVGGQWQSAYGSGGSMRSWRAGSWHHLAFTWSSSLNRIAFYVDGRMAAVNNEGHYWAPPATGVAFSLGGSLDGAGAAYLIDEVRISALPLGDGEIAASAAREGPCPDQELGLLLSGRNAGDRIVLEWETPQGGVCATAPYTFPGVPIREVEPPSTLLPAASTSVPLTVTTAAATSCRYSVNASVSFDEMTPFDSGAGSTLHKATVRGLSADTTRVNEVYLRCASDPDYLHRLRYRALPTPNPAFPRTGNLWGWWPWAAKGLDYMSRIDLWLGADPTP